MKDHKKLTIWIGAIYLGILLILGAIYWIFKGEYSSVLTIDATLAWAMLTAIVLSFVISTVHGVSLITFISPLIFGIGTGVYQVLTEDLFLNLNPTLVPLYSWSIRRRTFEYAIAMVVVCLIFSVIGIWVHYVIKYLTDTKKLNRIMWISYGGLLIFSILIFRYCISGDASGSFIYAFVFAIGFLTILPAVLTLICAIKHGACLSVLIMPVAFFIGAFVNTFLTWNLHWYLCGSLDPFRIQWYYSLLPLIATSAALALGLGVHYAVKYFKKSRAVA